MIRSSNSPLDGNNLLSSLDGAGKTKSKDDASRIQASTIILSPTTTYLTKERAGQISSLELDHVERILDANTIQLNKKGIVRLAMVRMPSASSNFQFPDCFTFSPSYKIRQLIPKSTAVRVQTVASGSSNKPPAVILIREDNSVNVNRELVRSGFAKVIRSSTTNMDDSPLRLLDQNELLSMQKKAEDDGVGIFSRCDAKSKERSDGGGISKLPVVEAQFEPLERTMETVWTDDGGKLRPRIEKSRDSVQPANPGDIKGCSDFRSYEDALRWYERYEPLYGDVAKLDRDSDGVPCPGLPHTLDKNLYRMKVPKSSVGISR